jgi:hypothetical protein
MLPNQEENGARNTTPKDEKAGSPAHFGNPAIFKIYRLFR